MIGVVIHLEDPWNYMQSDRDIDIMQMYWETIRAFNVDAFILIDKTSEGLFSKSTRTDLAFSVYKNLKEALADYPNLTRLFFEHTNAIPSEANYVSLSNLSHPTDDVLYIFGGDLGGLDLDDIQFKPSDKIVYIDLDNFILWSIVALTVALYDRKIKGGRA